MALIVPVRRDLAAETHLDLVLVARNQPALGCDAPVVGRLGLLPVTEHLTEDAQLIADGIARSLNAERGHAVHVAGGQSAQTAVSEPGIRLRLKDIGSLEAKILQRAGQRLPDSEVVCVFHQAAAHEKFHGQIVNFLFHAVRVLGCQKTAHQLADDNRRSLKDLRLGRKGRCDTEMGTELVGDGASNFIAGNLTDHIKTSIRAE